jgi:hypothetical protein
MTAAASLFGDRYTRFRLPAAVRTSAAHFGPGRRYAVPAAVNGKYCGRPRYGEADVGLALAVDDGRPRG